MEAAKNVLVAVAPTIASAFGTPMAGVATKAVLEALGLKKDSTDKELEAAILTANPEQLLAIKKADQEFKLQMKQLDVDLIKIVNEDRDSARNREAQVKDTTPKVLAYLLCMLYISVQIFLLTHVIPETMREMVMRALGTLDALLGLVFSYYFGSSVGEVKRQTETRELKKD
jgi:hypothetical protein